MEEEAREIDRSSDVCDIMESSIIERRPSKSMPEIRPERNSKRSLGFWLPRSHPVRALPDETCSWIESNRRRKGTKDAAGFPVSAGNEPMM